MGAPVDDDPPDFEGGDRLPTSSERVVVAVLERAGLVSHASAHVLLEVMTKIVPLNYEAAVSVINQVIEEQPPWEYCEICRRVMYDWRLALVNQHNLGHPLPVQPEEAEE